MIKDETLNYQLEHMVCTGCKKKFCLTVNVIPDSEVTDIGGSFCMACYNNRYGTNRTFKVIKEFNKEDKISAYLWETKTSEIPNKIYKTIPFFVKGLSKNA